MRASGRGSGSLTFTALQRFPLVKQGVSIGELIADVLVDNQIELQSGDCFAVSSKIVSKAEGRQIALSDVSASDQARELANVTEKDPRLVEIVLSESKEVLRTRPGLIIVEHRLGFVCANAGIDHSNVGPQGEPDSVLLLPEDPDRSADAIRRDLTEAFAVEIGVVIIDSHGRAWRLGTVGIAIGVAGLPALTDLRGAPDLYDVALEVTQVGTADELAAGASLLTGQAAEQTPVIHIRGFPYPLRESSLSEVLRPFGEDLFR